MDVPNIVMHIGDSEGFRAFMSRYEPALKGGITRGQLFDAFREFTRKHKYETPNNCHAVLRNQFYEAVRRSGVREDTQGQFKIKVKGDQMEYNIIWRDCSKSRSSKGKHSPNYDVSLSVINRKNKEKEVIGKTLNVYFRNKGLEVAKKYKYLIISSLSGSRIYFEFLPDDKAFSNQGRALSMTNKSDANPSMTTAFPLSEDEIITATSWAGEYELRLDTRQKHYFIEKAR